MLFILLHTNDKHLFLIGLFVLCFIIHIPMIGIAFWLFLHFKLVCIIIVFILVIIITSIYQYETKQY